MVIFIFYIYFDFYICGGYLRKFLQNTSRNFMFCEAASQNANAKKKLRFAKFDSSNAKSSSQNTKFLRKLSSQIARKKKTFALFSPIAKKNVCTFLPNCKKKKTFALFSLIAKKKRLHFSPNRKQKNVRIMRFARRCFFFFFAMGNPNFLNTHIWKKKMTHNPNHILKHSRLIMLWKSNLANYWNTFSNIEFSNIVKLSDHKRCYNFSYNIFTISFSERNHSEN